MRWQHRHEEDLIRIDERACEHQNATLPTWFSMGAVASATFRPEVVPIG
jgi:hypothetical protein